MAPPTRCLATSGSGDLNRLVGEARMEGPILSMPTRQFLRKVSVFLFDGSLIEEAQFVFCLFL